MKTVTVITGGAGGIRLATAKILGKDHHVVLGDINRDKLDSAINELREMNVPCNAVLCDVRDRNSADDLAAASREKGKVASMAGYFLPKLVIPKRSYTLSGTREEKFLRRMRSA